MNAVYFVLTGLLVLLIIIFFLAKKEAKNLGSSREKGSKIKRWR